MRRRQIILLLAASNAFSAVAANVGAVEMPSDEETTQIAEDAFIYGYPLVMGYGVMYDYAIDAQAAQYKAPFNQLYNTARVYTPQDTAVVTPNSDTPYSFVWADLRAEPIVITVPKVEPDRYYSVQFVDLYTFNYAYVGSRTTGNEPGTFVVAGPNWEGETPKGVDRVFRCETDFSFIIFRTQLFGPDDLENVQAIQAGYRVEPLSAFLDQPAPPNAPDVDWPKFSKQESASNPFAYLNFLLRFCPPTGPAKAEASLRSRFAQIGVEAGQPFRLDQLTARQRESVVQGMKNGLAKIKKQVARIGRAENGWRLGSAAGDRDFYQGDWLLRAAGAMAGIYGNSREEAFYPFLVADEQGDRPDGSKQRYTLTFAPNELPPVNAFWSITVYDAKTQMLVENPIDRYLINSPMLPSLNKNDDGSWTIYIQSDSPGKAKEANWLPAPNGPIFLVMRLYEPKKKVLSGAWKPPPLRRAGPVEAADVLRRQSTGERPGNKSVENIVRTDERYGHDGLFQGPRGWSYWNNLKSPRPIQNPNLWPDAQSTYFLSQFSLPSGSTLSLRFRYPRSRYFQFALYQAQQGTFVSIGEALAGPKIEPDQGSINPFRVGANRHAENRSCTMRIIASDPPPEEAARPGNAMYVGSSGSLLQGVIRIYLPDQGWDGAGWGPAHGPGTEHAFDYDVTLADGTHLSAEEAVERFSRPIEGATSPPLTADQWVALVNSEENDPSLNPATAPARREPRWEKYWGIPYSIVGAFKAPAQRAKISIAEAIDGGGDPATQYFLTHLSRQFGKVYVMRGKMPTFPDTYAGSDGKGLAVMPDYQTAYWSLVSCEAAPSGQIVDGLADMQVPLDKNRNYTIVYSRREDRPSNATLENGVAWIEWSPRGEGLDHPRNREDFGMLMLRIMATNPAWKQRPDNVVRPGDEETVMGPYLPRGEYMDKASFEQEGPGREE